MEPDHLPNDTGARGRWPARHRRPTLRRGLGPAVAALIILPAAACTSSAAGPSSTIAAGSPWSGAFATVVLPTPVNSLAAVDCPTDTSCLAVGSTAGSAGVPNGAAVIATTDGGATWASQVIPATAGYLSGISCSDQRDCVAVGQATQSADGLAAVIATTDGGRSWQARPVPPGFLDVTAVSCRADHRCIAVGDVAGGAAVLSSASGGSAWVQRGALPPGVSGATGVSCSDDVHCWVTARRAPDPYHVAGVVALTSDGGSTWTVLPTPTGIGYLNGISCRGSAAGNGALPFSSTSRPDPAAGQAGATPNATTASTVAPTASTATTAPVVVGVAGVHCTVVGTTSDTPDMARTGRGVILTTGNGGAAWSARTVPASSASLTGVSCTAIDSCVMVGSTVSTSARAGSVILTGPTGSQWKRTAEVDAPQPLTGVSCLSQSRCVVVGESISEHLVAD
ncbi:MAG: WD40/YVTN/BNR-like repeat-containing protein [Acidimicrobiales bacterium]